MIQFLHDLLKLFARGQFKGAQILLSRGFKDSEAESLWSLSSGSNKLKFKSLGLFDLHEINILRYLLSTF